MAQVLFMLAEDSMQVYRARNPGKSPLWQCARRHYDEFEKVYPDKYQPRLGSLRPIIPDVVHKFLECGDLQRGFARVRCDHCQHEYLLAFSCKSRWFCPSCHQKNVQTSARFILDHVVAPVPHRHYVLAIPKMLRAYFQRHRYLLKDLCRLAQESLTEYLRTALACPKGLTGIIMTLHQPISWPPQQAGDWRPEAVGWRPMRDHTKLRAFELADKLALATYEQTRSFPREEVFGLTSQLRRAAVSIASNIVEGAARFSEAEYLRFLDTAYGSAREVEYQLGLAFRLGFLSEPSHRELSALSIETSKVLNGLLRSLRKH